MQTSHIECSQKVENLAKGQSLRRRKRALKTSAALCVAIMACYWWQPDCLAPVTLVPTWCWLVPAFALTAYGISRRHKFLSLMVPMLWTAYTAILVEEVWSLARSGTSRPTAEWQVAHEHGRGIRVVSLNCAVSDARAAAEVGKWKPDIVLLQESPYGEHLDRLSQELFGAEGTFVWGGDTSIFARGQIQPHDIDCNSHFVHATVTLPSGLIADVISVRLSPPVFRLDFWMPGFWIDHRDNRIRHRRQILDVMQRIRTVPTPLIIGGDFNAPPGDAALAPLQQRLFDTFRKAGHGWGNTGTNSYPLFRVDQIWVSPHFRAASVTAQKTVYSDHRMVVCDLIYK